ncbi:MAG: alpha/beta fold hydrolase [Undibacterium sp.]|nr:alpha/beta fold hydrolase [Opitutaceae bacterium]
MSERLKAAATRLGLPLPAADTPEAWAELAVDVFLRPPAPTRVPPREQSYLAGATRGTVATRAGELATWTWSAVDRPLVLLAHGWAGRGAQLGAFAEPLVAAGFRVVAFDGPGHGASPGTEAHVPLFAQCIAEIAEKSGGAHAVVGHSMGAASAAMATVMGLKPRGLVLIAPPLSHRGRVERVAARLELEPEVRKLFLGAAERRVGWKDEDVDMRVVARRAPCPVVVFHDPEDEATAFTESEEFVAEWSGARLVPCPGRGHFRILVTAEVVEETVRFLVGLRVGADRK